MLTTIGRFGCTVLAIVALGASLGAAEPAVTKITVPDLDCASCGKKLVAKVQAVPGVAEAKADVEGKTVTVTHKAKANPSPLALWEAIEKGGKEATKLEGPSGTFTSKPKS